MPESFAPGDLVTFHGFPTAKDYGIVRIVDVQKVGYAPSGTAFFWESTDLAPYTSKSIKGSWIEAEYMKLYKPKPNEKKDHIAYLKAITGDF